jgi:nucleotide-binding universal stress UspA family protein
MTILCATDFSPSSEQATRLAGAMARRLNDSVMLVHAIEPLLQAVPYGMPGAEGWNAEMRSSAEVMMASAVSQLRERGVSAQSRLLAGSASSSLMGAVREHSPRLVVMGTHGRKGVGRLFLGSVAGHIVKHADCPVLVTRAGDAISDSWEDGQPLRFSVGVDGTAAADAAFAWLAGLPRSFAQHATIVRLFWPFEEAIRYGVDEPWQGTEANPALLPLLERDVRQLAAKHLTDDRSAVRMCMAHVDAAEVLAAESQRIGTDALVVGVPHGRAKAWNALVVSDLLRSANAPVFCIPQTAALTAERLPEFRSVLVATDLADHSDQAVLPAYGMVRAGGHVELVHVHVQEVRGGPANYDVRPLTEERRQALLTQLRRLVPEEATARGIVTTASVVEGPNAAVAIVQAAERLGVDALALASHHRKGIKRAVLGSVAEEVTRRTDRPVLITHSLGSSS